VSSPWFRRIAYLATAVAFCVIVLGAFVRLTDAGLGCPDWPTCYGQITPPDAEHEIAAAQEAYPGAVVVRHKAWHEMIHRYLASTLGLLIIALAVIAWRNRRDPAQPLTIPLLLVLLVCFQGALGMWTVTLLLRPAIVTLHLLMGMATLALLTWTALRSSDASSAPAPRAASGGGLRTWAAMGLLVLFCQIGLGGWTSTNYAALQCMDFPTCQGHWWPPTDFAAAFDILGEPGVNYEGGRLDNDARVTIHLTHRIGALVTFLFLAGMGIAVLRSSNAAARAPAWSLLAILLLQVALGISNVLFSLPLTLAVAHNGGAALLLVSLVALNHRLRRQTGAPAPAS
jgi:cytochrome c oxidase assembly protein subunit 15